MGQILIYVDQGVSGEALRQVVKSLQKEVAISRHPLKRMDANALKSESWEKETDLLIVPGGRDIYYHDLLKGNGAQKIASFVRNGGAYLGLCAGAYFASTRFEFEKGGAMEMCAERELGFYPGVVRGSAYGLNKYSYDSDSGSEAALVSWKKKPGYIYFNGGCVFERPEQYSNVQVLATFSDLKEDPAAIVRCTVGKGRAVLSGVHFEFCVEHMQHRESPHIQRILPLLHKGETQRRELFREVLSHLGLTLQ